MRFAQARGSRFQLVDEDKQRVPVDTGPGNPQTLDRYSYALNNPIRYTDPSGHFIPLAVAALFTSEVLLAVVALFVVYSFVTAVISCSQDSDCSAVLGRFADQLNQGATSVREFLGGIQQSLAEARSPTFREDLDDIQANPEDWEVVSVSTEPATGKSVKGGTSTEEILVNVKNGHELTRHTVRRENGSVYEQHYRPYPKQQRDE